MKLAHLGLNCDDPKSMENFYTRYFGFERTKAFHVGGNDIVMLKLGDFYLELFKATVPFPLKTPEGTGADFKGVKHICFSVDDLAAEIAKLKNVVEITLGPLSLDAIVPGMTACWLKDPEGNIIELAQGYRD